MLTFQTTDLLVVLIAGVLLTVGLSYLALRRRNEILQDYLTPNEPDIDREFFKKHPAPEADETDQAEEQPDIEASNEENAAWGIPVEEDSTSA